MNEPKALPNLDEDNSWQKFCTEALLDALKLPEHQRAVAWSDTCKKLVKLAQRLISNPRHQRIIIADANLKKETLEGFDFSRCYIVRTHFDSANLRESNFTCAMLRDCFFTGADANGANFALTDLKATNVDGLKYNTRTRLHFACFNPSGFVSPQLEDRINQDRLKAANRDAPTLYRLLNVLTGYGYRIRRVLATSVVAIFLFAAVYWIIDPQDFAIGAGTSRPESLTFWNSLLFSLERFLNASTWIYGVSALTHFLTTLETVLGLLFLAMLVAMLIRRVLRSS